MYYVVLLIFGHIGRPLGPVKSKRELMQGACVSAAGIRRGMSVNR